VGEWFLLVSGIRIFGRTGKKWLAPLVVAVDDGSEKLWSYLV
jgi:hypothetical protein